jgi:hypothetical protein
MALTSSREECVDPLDEGNVGPFELADIALSWTLLDQTANYRRR